MMTPDQRHKLESHFHANVSKPLERLEQLKTVHRKPAPTDKCIDVSKHSILSLKNWARTSLRDSRNSALSQKDRYNAEIYWDGYMRAIEHILDMEEQ